MMNSSKSGRTRRRPSSFVPLTFFALCLSCVQAQEGSGIEVKLAARRSTILSFQKVELMVTVTNRGSVPSGEIRREDIVPEHCIIAAIPAGPGTPRQGQWAERVGVPTIGTIGSLLPDESFSTTLRVSLPDGLQSEQGGVLHVQWIGRSGMFEGQRSDEVMLNVRSGKNPIVTLDTSEGQIVLELWPDKAPNHVANFVSLVRGGFFNGKTWHRVIPNFMIQTGCPLGTGLGNPGYFIPAEITETDFKKGVLGMARMKGNHDSGGSQFFIMVADRPALNKEYTAFGRVLEGQDIADKISRVPTLKDPPAQDRPITPVKLREVQVEVPSDYELPEIKKVDPDKKPTIEPEPKKDGEKEQGASTEGASKKDGEKKDGEKKDGEKKDGEKKDDGSSKGK